MDNVKYCKRCGVVISVSENSDWYSHMSKKYCDECRRQSDRKKTALRVAALRQRKKQKEHFRDEQLALLKEENKLLRNRVIELRES